MNDELVLVRIVNFPVALARRAAREREALLRELALIRFSDDDVRASLPTRLVEMAEQTRAILSTSEVIGRDEVQEAVQRGAEHVSFEARIPPALGERIEQLFELITEADEYCRRGDLITLETAPECRAFREWFVGEITGQLEGRAPRAWSDAVG